MSQEHRLEPREALPYSDNEIRELFLRAREAETPVETPVSNVPEDRFASFARSIIPFLSMFAIYVLAISLGSPFVRSPMAFAVIACISILVWFALTSRLQAKDLRPAEVLERWESSREAQSAFMKIDPSDPKVLAAVVDYVAREPLREEEALQKSIASSVESLQHSLDELPLLEEELSREAAASEDPAIRTLIESRLDAARGTQRRLEELYREFLRQAEEARLAVEPIRKLCARFDYLQRVGSSLARIQAAHGLAEEGEQSIEENRLQLKMLWATSQRATARLHEIESIVKAHESAKAELSSP
ncbi:MAG TPA: hypothetical protein VGE01_13620 [Fimbriimonas sp.]